MAEIKIDPIKETIINFLLRRIFRLTKSFSSVLIVMERRMMIVI